MTLRYVLPVIAKDRGRRSLCPSGHIWKKSQDCLVNTIANDFELRSHLKLDQLIALSHRSDKAV
jgi:hypothetical protein